MAEIKYLTGNATDPKGGGRKIIAHICNDIGEWGEGFCLALSQKWVQPEIAYRQWHLKKYYKENRRRIPFVLGQIQFIPYVEYDISVVNMIAQEGIARIGAQPPIRYKAIEQCFERLSILAIQQHYSSIHIPRTDKTQTGADWQIIEDAITLELIQKDINVFVYDLP